MNAIRGMVKLSLRGYRTNRGGTSVRRSKPPERFGIMRPEITEDDLLEELENPDDLDAFESDFSNLGKIDKMHETETKLQKAKLMTQIVKRKYFKTDEPAMLTWGEKEQIRHLHNEDPAEWTADKLSESFPASREAVLKLLRSKWSVRNPKTVEGYERRVKENWALLRAGKLNVEPKLAAHLAKFKDRKIETMKKEDIAKKIVKPKPVFPEPQSTMFSDIIRSYRDEREDSDDDDDDDEEVAETEKTPALEAPKGKRFQDIVGSKSTGQRRGPELPLTPKLVTEQKLSPGISVTFDQFLQNRVETVKESDMTPVDRVLVDELKRKTTEAYKNKSLVFESQSPVLAWKQDHENDEPHKTNARDDRLATSSSTSEQNRESSITPNHENNDSIVETAKPEIGVKPETALIGSIETGIIARQKTGASLQENYPDFVRIPTTKYKRGATYKIQDRYYDDDGEFLYRVPGLKS